MKFIFFLIIVFVASVARLNLPENKVNSNLFYNEETSTISKLAVKMLLSESVADWSYTDFVFVKFACSERMKMRLVGLPFQQWMLQEDDLETCKMSLDNLKSDR